MNCATIDAILDEHRSARLDASERQAVAAHLGSCARCSDLWAAYDALLGESMGEPPPELLARACSRVSRHPAPARIGSRPLAALAAAAAVAAVAVTTATISLTDAGSGGAALAPGVTATVTAAEPVFVTGRDYEVLSRPAAASEAVERISVVEFFTYPCLHCYTFEADLNAWDAPPQQHAALTRVPVVWNRDAELQARAFYTAEVLGRLDAMHAAFYEEIHARGNRLASIAALAEFFQRFGIDAATFDEAFNSREVDARVQRAVALGREYGVRATPSLVVGGRYRTNQSMAGARLLAVVDYLVARVAAQSCSGQTGDEPATRGACPPRPIATESGPTF